MTEDLKSYWNSKIGILFFQSCIMDKVNMEEEYYRIKRILRLHPEKELLELYNGKDPEYFKEYCNGTCFYYDIAVRKSSEDIFDAVEEILTEQLAAEKIEKVTKWEKLSLKEQAIVSKEILYVSLYLHEWLLEYDKKSAYIMEVAKFYDWYQYARMDLASEEHYAKMYIREIAINKIMLKCKDLFIELHSGQSKKSQVEQIANRLACQLHCADDISPMTACRKMLKFYRDSSINYSKTKLEKKLHAALELAYTILKRSREMQGIYTEEIFDLVEEYYDEFPEEYSSRITNMLNAKGKNNAEMIDAYIYSIYIRASRYILYQELEK